MTTDLADPLMDIAVAAAELEDMAGCAAIFNAWVDETSWMPRVHPADDVERFYREVFFAQNTVLIAKSNDARVRGFMVLGSDGFVNALYLDPSVRRSGLGARLVAKAKSLCPDGLRLWTFQDNTGAQRFYLREGFQEVRRTEGDNEEDLPDILYEWRPEAQS